MEAYNFVLVSSVCKYSGAVIKIWQVSTFSQTLEYSPYKVHGGFL